MRFPKGLIPQRLGAALIGLALLATPAMAAFWQWSQTAATNATADPTINWSEGMSPSSVNDSARAMMARAAEYRDDISGSITTTGTATAYSLTTNQGLNATPVTGQLIAFTVHVTSGNAPTMTVDGGNTYPLQTSPGTGVTNGTLVLGTPYTAKFNGTAWILRDFYGNPYIVPIGMLMPFTGSSVPNSNFVMPYGQCISRTTYATYFAQVGTTFGACDGTTTFAVPDLRGRIIAALDNLGGSAANRLTADANGCGTSFTTLGATCANGTESKTLTIAQMPAHDHGGQTGLMAATLALTGVSITTQLPTTNNTTLNGGADHVQLNGQSGSSVITNGSHTHSIPSQGGGGPFSSVMPVIGFYYLLRVI